MKTFLALLIFVFASPLYANTVFENYVQWIVDNSDFEYNGEELPTVKRIPEDWLEIYAYGDQAVADAERKGNVLPNVLALYDNKSNQIILPEGFDLNDFSKHHIIVHELVHYLQNINGEYDTEQAKRCIQSLEPEAYRLHTKWMDEVDHPAERPNELFVALLTMSCIDYQNRMR